MLILIRFNLLLCFVVACIFNKIIIDSSLPYTYRRTLSIFTASEKSYESNVNNAADVAKQ